MAARGRFAKRIALELVQVGLLEVDGVVTITAKRTQRSLIPPTAPLFPALGQEPQKAFFLPALPSGDWAKGSAPEFSSSSSFVLSAITALGAADDVEVAQVDGVDLVLL